MKQLLYYGYECIGDTGISLLLSKFKKKEYKSTKAINLISEIYQIIYINKIFNPS